MTVYIDADACPVVKIAENISKLHGVPVVLLCDTNHILRSDYSNVEVIDAGADSVDFALVNRCGKGDIVITQDYGVAAMALSKGAHAIHQNGKIYSENNIDGLLAQRFIAKEARRASSKNHLKGPKKRTSEDDKNFELAFEKLLIKLV
ncbi:MAG: YaiI/YqxD family protein [Clostridiales bacterium]|nr:MAG: YaiI/YqxD family protein [Clostridiales bacterium]